MDQLILLLRERAWESSSGAGDCNIYGTKRTLGFLNG